MALRDHFLDENVWMASAKDPRTEAENAVLADVMTGVPLPQAAAFLVASATAMACPMQTAAKSQSQTVASSNSNSTPIPAKGSAGSNG